MPDASALLARLRDEGRRVYLDEGDRARLRVSGEMTPGLKAELIAAKPELLQLLEQENLAEEMAKASGPFDRLDPEEKVAAMLVRYSCWKVERWVSETGWVVFPLYSPDG